MQDLKLEMEEDEIEESKKNYETEITQTPELTTNI
jgi:hypothetical protein